MATQNNFTDIYEEFRAVLAKGDEQAARQFLTDNFLKFPEDVREEITMAFFEEAVTDKAAKITEIAALQKEGTQAFAELSKEKKVLEDTVAVQNIKKDLGI